MTLSKYYSSTDEGAPQLSTKTAGSLLAVLDACLVSGYLDKSPLGWTTPFYDVASNTRVYRNSPDDGTGMYMRVTDNSVVGNAGCAVKMYASMDTLYTGIDPMPPLTNYKLYKCAFDIEYTVPWVIIGDNRGFYLLLYLHRATEDLQKIANVEYFGDFISYIPSYRKLYGLIGTYFVSVNAKLQPMIACPFSTTMPDLGSSCFINRDPFTGRYGATIIRVAPTFYSYAAITGAPIGSFPIAPERINSVPFLSSNFLYDASNRVVGKLPGLFFNLVQVGATSNIPYDAIATNFLVSNNVSYLSFPTRNMNISNDTSFANGVSLLSLLIGEGFRV